MLDNEKELETPMYLCDLTADELAFIEIYRNASSEEKREVDCLIESYSDTQE